MSGPSFELTEEQRELQRVAHEFAERELRPVAAECDARSEFPDGLLERAARAGLTSYAIPEEYGGGGVSAMTASLIAEELSWGCAGLAGTIQATMFPVRPLLYAGSQEQRDRYLRLLASEPGTLAAIAFTEPHAGSDLTAIRASAVREGDDYLLNGEKCYVTNGGIAAITVVFAKVDGGMTAFVLEDGDPGVVAGRKEDKLGLKASYTGSILLEDARIPAARRLGEEGQGLALAMDFFEASRPQVAAAAVGVARAAFEHAADYA
nr:acyl-CoA dehydrogenase family protein [Actinomycetota bacterium]